MNTPVVTSVEAIGAYRLWVEFSDGKSGEVDLEQHLWGPAFDQLRDPAYFRKVGIDPRSRTLSWPNGVDIAPETLYRQALGESSPAISPPAAG